MLPSQLPRWLSWLQPQPDHEEDHYDADAADHAGADVADDVNADVLSLREAISNQNCCHCLLLISIWQALSRLCLLACLSHSYSGLREMIYFLGVAFHQ